MFAIQEVGGQEQIDVHRIQFMKNKEGLTELLFIRQYALGDFLDELDHRDYGTSMGVVIATYENDQKKLTKRVIRFYNNYLAAIELPLPELPGAIGLELAYSENGSITTVIPTPANLFGKVLTRSLIQYFPYDCRNYLDQYIKQLNY